MHRTASLTATLLAFAILPACSSLTPPALSVEGVTVGERTAQGVVAVFTVVGTNPNPDSLPLRKINYRVTLGGKDVFVGERAPMVTLQPNGSQRFTIPASIIAADLPQGTSVGVFEFSLNGRVIYAEPGPISELLFDSGVSQPEAQFSGVGVLDLGR